MSPDPWTIVETELARTAERGAVTRFWLRDDDAVDVTPALEKLGRACAEARMPVLLAVIPADATPALARWIDAQPLVTPCQHGWSHANRAPLGERACELGGERPDAAVEAELRAGQARMVELFGTRAVAVLVPPWNRIRTSLLPGLPSLGYTGLSVFAHAGRKGPAPLPELNCDLDIIDWRNGRRGRTMEDLCGRLAGLIGAARSSGAPIGLLTHHLAHDDAAWRFIEAFLARMAAHPGVTFVKSDALLATRPLSIPDPRRIVRSTAR